MNLRLKWKVIKKTTVYVKETDTVSTLKEKIVEQLKKNTKEEKNIFMKKKWKEEETKHMGKYERIHKQNAKLEEKHYEKNEILPARITLRLDENGSPLEDGKTMKECRIAPAKYGNYAYVYLTLDELEIKVEGDKNAIVYVKETDKVSMMKQTIVEKLRENIYKEIEIIETELWGKENEETKITTFIKTKLIGINKRIDKLNAKLKEKNNEKNKILTARKTLRLDKNGSPLEDWQTMKQYCNEKNGATVFLALEGFEIFVHYKGKTYTIWANNEDTVYKLKESIEKVIGIHHTEQALSFPTHNVVLNDIEKTMHSYNIGKGASLSLWREFQIGCQYKRKEYFPIVEETEKVSSVKEKVKEMINKEINEENEKVKKEINDEKKVKKEIQENGILLNNIRLSYWGEELKDNAEIGSYDRIGSKSAIVYVYEA
ncbi:hypothetical protein niasHT_033862 [Heterodera trifolii]|uniref:Ubiquitin-like domain-containing protein n=1 Tax=Heterodera trifolii TaxID=157864 RepID=A0ABD2IPQ3_9BILA